MLYYQGENQPTYYLPTYVRSRILSIAKIKYDEMTAEINAEILITIMFPQVEIQKKSDKKDQSQENAKQMIKDVILDEGIKCSF